MKTISRNKMIEMLKDAAKGTRIVGIQYTTEPKLTKKHRETKVECPYTNVLKHTENTIMLGVDYAKRLAKRGEEPAGAKPFYEEVDGQNWLVQHPTTKQMYLRASPTGGNKPKSFYTSEGVEVAKDDLAGYLPVPKDEPVDVFTIKVDGIRILTFNGEQYQVVG